MTKKKKMTYHINIYNGFTEAMGVLGPCRMRGKHGGEGG